MHKGNKILKTESVIRYLLGRIRQSGPEPELLPGEMELCAQLNVSRVTVRRALESLSAANYIIRLPKRKGAFSNPEMTKNIPCTIGIVAAGCPFQMNGFYAISLSSFLKKMGACELFSWGHSQQQSAGIVLDFPSGGMLSCHPASDRTPFPRGLHCHAV